MNDLEKETLKGCVEVRKSKEKGETWDSEMTHSKKIPPFQYTATRNWAQAE